MLKYILLVIYIIKCNCLLFPLLSLSHTSSSSSTLLIRISTKLYCSSSSDESNNDDVQAKIAKLLASTSSSSSLSSSSITTTNESIIIEDNNINEYSIKTKKIIALASSLLATFIFLFQRNQPVNAVALMKEMEKDSIPVKEALCNGKPTIIDFYADWCESCKVMAPTMRELESKYGNNINFITLDGTDPNNSEFVSRFKVDGIPHVAFITPQAEVKTALVGAVPVKVLVSDIKALIKNEELPYEGYDAFEDLSHFPFKDLTKICSAT